MIKYCRANYGGYSNEIPSFTVGSEYFVYDGEFVVSMVSEKIGPNNPIPFISVGLLEKGVKAMELLKMKQIYVMQSGMNDDMYAVIGDKK